MGQSNCLILYKYELVFIYTKRLVRALFHFASYIEDILLIGNDTTIVILSLCNEEFATY